MSKPDIAIAEIDRAMAAGVRFGCVLVDAGYGSGAAFRQALSERNLLWAFGLSSRQTVYAADVELTFPTARGGRPRKYHIPDQAPVSVADMLAGETRRKVAWRPCTKGRLTSAAALQRLAGRFFPARKRAPRGCGCAAPKIIPRQTSPAALRPSRGQRRSTPRGTFDLRTTQTPQRSTR